MIALVDPALFIRPGAPDTPLSPADEAAFNKELGDALVACRAANAEIAAVDDHWDRLWREIIAPLDQRLRSQPGKQRLHELRKAGRPFKGLAAPPVGTHVWGFRNMFGQLPGISPEWEERMADAAARLLPLGRPMMLMARLVEGRNLRTHTGKSHSVIGEVTRWRLSVRPPASARSTPIPCVRSAVQVVRPWTSRYDERLPTDREGGRYPFCLPPGEQWARRDLVAVRTMESVPAWVDRAGRGWARPDIPGGRGYHWDVFFDDLGDTDRIGVNQLNVVQHGAPPAEGTAGGLHHVPTTKAGKVSDVGWTCP